MVVICIKTYYLDKEYIWTEEDFAYVAWSRDMHMYVSVCAPEHTKASLERNLPYLIINL